MASTDPPAFFTSIFNSEAYSGQSGFITLDYANKTYLKLVGGSIFGPLSIGGTLNAGGIVSFTNNTNATSKTTGALIVNGGVGIGGDLYTSNISATNLTLTGSISGATTFSSSGIMTLSSTAISNATNNGALVVSGGVGVGGNLNVGGNLSGTNLTLNGSIAGVTTFGSSGMMTVSNATASSSSSTGALVISGGIGVGSTSYFGSGIVCTSSNDIITFSNTASVARLTLRFINDARSWEFGTRGSNASNANSMYIYDNTAGAYRLLINSSGFVGIGTAPSYLLDIAGQTKTAKLLVGDSSDTSRLISALDSTLNTNDFRYFTLGKANSLNNQVEITFFYAGDGSTNNRLGLGFYGGEKMTILASGKVGINITNPTYQLDVNGQSRIVSATNESLIISCGSTESIIALNATGTSGRKYWVGSSASGSSITAGSFFVYDQVAGVSRLTINSGGNVGIGTNSAWSALDVNGGLNTTSFYINKSQVISTATELNYVAGITLGTASANKALVLDSSLNITGINSLTSTYITVSTNLTMNNATATIKKLTLQSLANNYGVLSIKGGNNNSYAFGTSDSIIYGESSHPTSPIAFEMNVSIGSSATSTNPLRIGSITSNDFVLFTNSSERMRLDASGNVGIGTNAPSYKLDVNGNLRTTGVLMIGASTDSGRLLSALDGVSTAGSIRYLTLGSSNSAGNQAEVRFVYQSNNGSNNYLGIGMHSNADILNITNNARVGIGTTTPSYPLHVTSYATTNYSGYGYLNGSGVTGYVSGNSGNVNVSARFDYRVIVGGELNVVSDRRKKKNITKLDAEYCKSFIENIEPKKFQYDYVQDNQMSYGYIAQDVAKRNFHELVNLVPDESIVEEVDDDGFVSPAKTSFVLSNQNIIPILHMAIKDLYAKIEQLSKLIDPEKKAINPNDMIELEELQTDVLNDASYETVIVNGKKIKIKI